MRQVFYFGTWLGFVTGAIMAWALTRAVYEVPAHLTYELTGYCTTCERGDLKQ